MNTHSRQTLLALAFLALCNPALGFADPASVEKPLDVKEPPFGEFDYSWTNGTNRQPDPLLKAGPVTFSLYADAYYAYQFSNPSDHTIFQTTTAPRHNEINLNMAAIGMDLTGMDGPIGRVFLQYGNNVAADSGQDATLNRGYYLTHATLDPIQQAAAGWHFHSLHGVNVEFGIFPSYVGLESYLPEENWSYTHAFLSDFTPYYFSGSRTQIFITQRFKLEIWLVNGWQTLGQWHNSRLTGGYLWNWRPTGRLSASNAFYTGEEEQSDPDAHRYYTDNSIQYKYFEGSGNAIAKWMAIAVVGDYGYEVRSRGPGGPMAGLSLAHRLTFTDRWANTLRLDAFYDKTQAVVATLPSGAQLQSGQFLAGGVAATLDFNPSPWLLYRLEYSHRNANIPYFSGSGGISGGTTPPTPNATPDLRKSDDRIVVNVTLRL